MLSLPISRMGGKLLHAECIWQPKDNFTMESGSPYISMVQILALSRVNEVVGAGSGAKLVVAADWKI